jgi:GNAT superfamily N-acetyltransferase
VAENIAVFVDRSSGFDPKFVASPMRSPVPMRVMRADDIPAGLRLCRASGWNQIAADWERFLAFSPDGCRVALDDTGEVIGSVATLRFGEAFGWIAMVLVDPAHRRVGIGTSLLEEALRVLADIQVIGLDATPAGFHVYKPAGFEEATRLQRMQRTSAPAPRLHSVAVRSMDISDLDEVFEWDKQVFGADRRALLESFRSQAPAYALVAVGRPGYTFGRPGYDFDHIGPLVAQDEETAGSLVCACLAAHPHRRFIIDTPVRRSWLDWLELQGFALQRPLTRMYRGQRRYRDRPDESFAIAGPEFA